MVTQKEDLSYLLKFPVPEKGRNDKIQDLSRSYLYQLKFEQKTLTFKARTVTLY